MVPLMPNVGPCEGCLTHANTFFLRAAPRAWTRPMVVVLLPSPRGVGVILNIIKNSIIMTMYHTILFSSLYFKESAFHNFINPSITLITEHVSSILPGDYNVSAVFLSLQSFEDIQGDLGFLLSIQVHFLGEKVHFPG